MCEANAYLFKEGEEQLIMESIDLVRPEGDDSWHLVDIFGGQKLIKGRIREMNLVNHKVIFEE
ncbi:MAG: CooT family nickel-binding protein [Desulfatiglandaceae bacterium]|jgi:predicted RNA-binding protein